MGHSRGGLTGMERVVVNAHGLPGRPGLSTGEAACFREAGPNPHFAKRL